MEDNILRTPKKKSRTKPLKDIDSFDADAVKNYIFSYYSRNQNINKTKLLVSLKAADLLKRRKTNMSKIYFQFKKYAKKSYYRTL